MSSVAARLVGDGSNEGVVQCIDDRVAVGRGVGGMGQRRHVLDRVAAHTGSCLHDLDTFVEGTRLGDESESEEEVFVRAVEHECRYDAAQRIE